MRRVIAMTTACAALLLWSATSASAQSWTGLYIGGSIGNGFLSKDDSETVLFDTNLDGTFGDTVRTVAGADAFSTGFCPGLAVNATAASGCTDDENGIDFGGRVGYDWQIGRFVVGGLVDVSRTDVTDHLTAFSTTPAFYSFSRELQYATGFRGRAGFGSDRVLVYGTAGAAWGSIGQRFTTSNAVNTFIAVNQENDANDDGFAGESAWGYQAGGGVEFRVGPKVSVSGEYVFSSFDDRDNSIVRSQGPAPATNPFILVNASGTNFQRTDSFEFQTVRVGVNYRF